MDARPFRFGVSVPFVGGGREWLEKARVVEELGYDVLLVGDNPGVQAPLPALAAAAAATSRIRLSTYVLNPAVRPVSMLVHELATVDRLSDGRLEIGLGLGNRQLDELTQVGAEGRAGLLQRVISELRDAFAGRGSGVAFAQEAPPIVVAGVGPRLVELAAAQADVFLVSGASPRPTNVVGPSLFDLPTAERSYRRVREVAGDRVELASGLQVLAITENRRGVAEEVRTTQPHLTVDEILASPKVAIGTVTEIAQQLRDRRDQLGISYFIVGEASMHELVAVRELLKAGRRGARWDRRRLRERGAVKGLVGKVAVVTGAGGGIGRAASVALGGEGASLVLVDIDALALAESEKVLGETGAPVVCVCGDVSRSEDVQRYVGAALEAFGRIDVFFNNAGVEGPVADLVDYAEEEFDRVFATNVRGVFLGLKYVLPVMLAQGSGSVINTASLASHVGFTRTAGYVASKHSVLGLTRTAAAEVGGRGVRVNAISPGVIDTRMTRDLAAAFADASEGGSPDSILNATPLARKGEPDEVGAVVCFLASDAASYVTGAFLTIDGGMLATR